ncbi:dihydroorotase [Ruminococcus flavefaciens]|uniref:dihydroorotase n=1 Tax=Ruminococcus flavefaciens TaxID=1265 RepID=UPI0026EE92FD|nr:dihydroorotase [Ruminococcus flavefaciens]MDD7515613.1 dihydroorotase [Ruminococcus flavefaciens]MDY5692762.1 dihydroorotase [Ruminococcus flavefaciens]
MSQILIKNIRAVDTETDMTTDVLISGGKIAKLGENISAEADQVIDGTGLVLMPSIFDMHVHFRDPGFTYKEDVLTGCAAALAGGVTGVLAMPNTKPPCDTPETIRYIIEKAEGTGVEVYPVGCITNGMSGNGLCDYDALKAAGCICISDDGRPVENAEMMRKALELSNENGLLVASHCEDLSIINGGIMNKGETSEKLGVKGMDRASEDYITAREMILASSVNARIHICHVSTEGCAAMIRFAKSRGVKVTCETAPHYFMLTDKLLEKRDADYRMNPPLRTPDDVKAIIEAVKDGTIDCIITDHAPHAAEEKADFEKAPNGVVGLETSLAATLTALYHTGEIDLHRVVELMCVNPRKLLGLDVPAIKEGSTADLLIADINKKWTVEPEKLHSKSHNTVFKGMELTGKPLVTISKGEIRFDARNDK